ncbi:MAG: hypothetical protein WBD96_13970, partial [Pseudolabrys sp.]
AARIAGNKTFVTLMSGQADRRCIDLARQLGAYEFLTKPFSAADIGTILATHAFRCRCKSCWWTTLR